MARLRKLIAALLIALLSSPAGAAVYHFSDCGFGPSSDPSEIMAAPSACSNATGHNKAPSGCPACGEWFLVADLWTQFCRSDVDTTQGGVGNPWCLSPDAGIGDLTRKSFEFLMDGTGAEIVSGDTVLLCAGDCNGAGSATWYLEPHRSIYDCPSCNGGVAVPIAECVGAGNPNPCCQATAGMGRCGVAYVVFDPQVGTTTPGATIIEVKPFPGETVAMSGDMDNDNAYTPGTDAQRWWSSKKRNLETSAVGYKFSGFTVEKIAERAVNIAQGVGGGMVFDAMTFRYLGAGDGGGGSIGNGYFAPLTGDGGPKVMCGITDAAARTKINNSIDSYATFVFGGNQDGASLTVTNSHIHQTCQIVQRSNGNCFGAAHAATPAEVEACDPTYSSGDIRFEGNTIEGVFGLANGHQGRGWRWINNVAHDFFVGIVTEENVRDITITRNDLSCRGEFKTDYNGQCTSGISITDGDLGEKNCNDSGASTCGDGDDPCPRCSTYNVEVSRNRVWGADYYQGTGGAQLAFMRAGIIYTAHNSSAQIGGDDNAVIENNFVWYVQPPNSCEEYAEDRMGERPMLIASDDSILVRNNTVYGGGCPVVLRSGFSVYNGGGAGTTAHTFRDNLVAYMRSHRGSGGATGSDEMELIVSASASASAVENNLLHHGLDPSSSTVACRAGTSNGCGGGTNYPCASIVTTPSLGLTNGVANLCAPASFARVGAAHESKPGMDATTLPCCQWDLHLLGVQQAVNYGQAGALVDIDGQGRPNQLGPFCPYDCTDIGADELVPVGASIPPPIPPPDSSRRVQQ